MRAFAPQPELLLEGLRMLREQLGSDSSCVIVEKPGWLLAGCRDALVKALVDLRAKEAPRIPLEASLLLVLEGGEPSALVERASRLASALGLRGLAVTLEV